MIGVIGGNGVAATNRLCQLVEETMTRAGAYRDAHHPEMIIWQATQVPSRSMFLEGRGADWRPDYIRIARALKELGCDKICMCCNTAHFAIEEIQQAAGVEFINIIERVAMRCVGLNSKKVGVLASDGCVKFDLYGKWFSKCCPAAELIYPDVEMQKLVTQGICNAKSNARYGDCGDEMIPDRLFNRVVRSLIDKQCDTIVLGCTDINSVFDGRMVSGASVVDSLSVLAASICELSSFCRL